MLIYKSAHLLISGSGMRTGIIRLGNSRVDTCRQAVKLAFLLLALSGFMSCENKELYRCDDAVGLVNVKVVFHWPEDASVMPPLMRLHLYSPEGGLSFVGDFLSGGGIAQVPAGAAWYPVCFDYRGPQTVDFRGAGYRDTFEAYCYPREASLEGVPSPVVAEPSPDSFYAGYNAGLFAVPEDAIPGDTVILDMYPREALRAFSFLLVGVEDVSGIADIRGFFSGLPGSYFPGTGGVPASPSSLLFTGLAPLKDGMRQPWTQSQKALFSALSSSWDKPGSADAWTGGWITGRVASFPPPPLSSQTFRLALEALGKGGEDIYAIWDDEVTRQMRGALGANGTPEEQEQWRQRNGGYDIVLYNSGRLAIPEGGGGGGAFETGLDDWNNVDIPLGGPVF